MNRAPRHHAMVDFPQHQQRLWVVLEEDHEKALAEAAPKWIAVKEQIPVIDDETCYLGMNGNGYMSTFNSLKWVDGPAECPPRGYWHCYMLTPEENIPVMSGLSHWMPLPEPPAKEVKS